MDDDDEEDDNIVERMMCTMLCDCIYCLEYWPLRLSYSYVRKSLPTKRTANVEKNKNSTRKKNMTLFLLLFFFNCLSQMFSSSLIPRVIFFGHYLHVLFFINKFFTTQLKFAAQKFSPNLCVVESTRVANCVIFYTINVYVLNWKLIGFKMRW